MHIPLLASPPGLPPLVKGFMNVAGVAIPVLSLARLLGRREEDFHPYLHVIILKEITRPLGLVVDRVDAIARLRSEDIVHVSAEESLNGCVRSKTKIDKQDTYLLETEHLIGTRERQVLSELQAMQQQRLEELGQTP